MQYTFKKSLALILLPMVLKKIAQNSVLFQDFFAYSSNQLLLGCGSTYILIDFPILLKKSKIFRNMSILFRMNFTL
jgi:hypothetical protein